MSSFKDQAMRPRLSVAMIVRDEQDVLADSIRSVLAIADEIVVLDTGSADQTVTVARELGAEIGWTAWNDDFSAARNQCLAMVGGEWVLWLDAGEILADESAEELRAFVDRQAESSKAYTLMVQVPPADSDASAEQAAQLRLMPNREDLRFEGRVRETLRPSIEAAGLQIDAAPGRIVRHGRQHNQARKSARAQRNLKLAILEASERGDPLPPRLQLAIGEAYSDLGADEQARHAYRQTIEISRRGSTEMLEAYYGLLTTYDGDKFLSEVQLSTCIEALEVFPFDAQLLLVMGNYMQSRNRLDLAVRSFETAVKYGQVDLGAWHLSELAEMAACCLSLVLQAGEGGGDDHQARRVLEEALQCHPDCIRLLRLLIDLHTKQDRCAEAIEVADRLPIPQQQREPLHNAVRGACRAAKEDWTAALGYLQSAYLAGCDDPICLRWLSVTLLSNGQTEAAEPVLRDWKRLDPTNVELQAYLAVLQQESDAAQESPEEQLATDSTGRQFRIDQGIIVSETTPVKLPVISQISST